MNLFVIAASLVTLSMQTATTHPVSTQVPNGFDKVMLKFRMLHLGQQIGTASYERISTANDRRTQLTIDVTDNGVTVVATFDKLFKRDGMPEKKSYRGVVTSQSNSQTFSDEAVFTNGSVQYTVSKGPDVGMPKTISPPAAASLADQSELWFDGVTPKTGDTVTCTSFSVQTGSWESTVSTYVGDEDVKIKTKTYKTHHMHVKSDAGEIEMYLDDHSDIVVMDQVGAVRLERAE
jgi:hypothetical protein